MRTLLHDLKKGLVRCSRCGILKATDEIYMDENGIVNHKCDKRVEDDEGIKNILKRIEKLEDHNASFPYIEPSTILDGLHQEFDNKQLILAILDMLDEYANDGDAGPGHPVLPRRDLYMRDKCYKLKRQLTRTVK